MTAVRKIIALLIIVFIGLPILFGVIWVVGLTKATVSSEFISELPQEIIREIPDIAEEIFEEGQDERVIRDENTRAWFKAAADAGVTPKQLMDDIGLLDWLQYELSDSLDQVGEILRGERRPRPITIDLRPLKDILMRDEIEDYMMRVLSELPPCDEEGERQWIQIGRWGLDDRELPACRPEMEVAREALMEWRMDAVLEMENEVEIFEDIEFVPFGLSRALPILSSFLFVFPALFIFIGSLIAATSPASFFRWCGISTFLGALPALLLAFFVKHISLWGLRIAPFYSSEWDTWSPELQDLVFDKVSWIPMRIVDQLFSPVVTVAALVCVLGVVLFAISLMVRKKPRSKVTAAVPAPAETPAKAEIAEKVEDEAAKAEEKAEEAEEKIEEKIEEAEEKAEEIKDEAEEQEFELPEEEEPKKKK
jgi:predicted PurR-regulated permease PerM